MRALTLTAALLVATLPSTAGAAPVCRLVTDAAGDAKVATLVESRTIDVISADVATGPKTLVAALRLTSLQRDQATSGGASYLLYWTVGGVRQSLGYHVYVDGTAAGRFNKDTAAGSSISNEVDVTATADQSSSTITWTVPRTMVPALAKRGAKFGEFQARAQAAVNRRSDGSESRSLITGGDVAESRATYTDRTVSCVVAR